MTQISKYTPGICANCDADRGLHHYKTMQCPVGGREEMREGKAQEWMQTTFENMATVEACKLYTDQKALNVGLLEALRLTATRSRELLHRDAQGTIEDFETEVKNLLGAIIETNEQAIAKAEGRTDHV